VRRSIVQVPSPAITKVSLHTESDGSTRQGPSPAPVRRPVPVASADNPMTLVNATLAPCRTLFCCGVADGEVGGATVGVIVAEATAPNESLTWYVGGEETVPLNVGNGVNVTSPVVVFTVYVPSPATVSDANVQFGTDCVAPHRRTLDATSVRFGSLVSFDRTVIDCGVLYGPVEVSLTMLGATGGRTVGMSDADAQEAVGVNGAQPAPSWLHTMYVGGAVTVPVKLVAGVNVTMPVDVLNEYEPSTVER
jgi:hypothetical protein